MKASKLRLLSAAMSCVGMLISPYASFAAPLVKPQDVTLHPGGVLLGQAVDTQGGALMNTSVVLKSGSKEVARVQTDRAGKFAVQGLQGGVYEVDSVGQRSVYRLWAPNTAPPAAQKGVMLVSGNSFVRGQGCGCGVVDCGGACGAGVSGGTMQGIGAWLAQHPFLTAGTIAAAIAIPLALDDDDSSSP